MELSDDIYLKITELSDQGNDFLDNGDYDKAVLAFENGLKLLPEPQIQWEAYTWLKASVGDAHFHAKRFNECSEAEYDALNGVDGMGNPFIHLRLGQSLFELGNMERAESELLQAYMLEGKMIFSEDDPKYEEFILSKCDNL
ncbi:MAG: tetratricopeptide repeat protein [Methylococcales bacterium]